MADSHNRVRAETFVSEGFLLSWEDCVGSGYLNRLDWPTDEKMFEKNVFEIFSGILVNGSQENPDQVIRIYGFFEKL